MNFDRLERHALAHRGLTLACYDTLGTGVPIVLQHGLCGSAQQTAEAFPEDAGLRLLTLECPGHGRSPAAAAADISIAGFADDVVALIETRRLAPVILGGISMGAAIALRIAVRRPELVRALILARPAWVVEAGPANMRPNAEVGELLRQHAPGRALEIFDAGDTARRLAVEAPDNLASLRGFFTREPASATAELLTRISADGPGVTEDEVRAIQVPALLIGHGADAIHPVAHARRLADLLAHARVVEVTPKSVSREAYVHDMHAAIAAFIEEVSP